MRFLPINSWTKERIIKTIQEQFTIKSLSYGDRGTCKYRGANGAKCAVGVFIPDALYCPEMDKPQTYNNGTDVESILETFPYLTPYMPLELRAMQSLQVVHDHGDSRSDAQIKAELIAWVEKNVA
jgi:hypothetical protein